MKRKCSSRCLKRVRNQISLAGPGAVKFSHQGLSRGSALPFT